MTAHFAYKHMPASGVGILDDQYRPYSTGGIGASVPAYLPSYIDPDTIDARPLLLPPEVLRGEALVGFPLLGPVSEAFNPVVVSIPYLDIVSMTLGIRPLLEYGAGVAMSVLGILGVAPESSFILSVEDVGDEVVVSDTLIELTVGIAHGVDMNLGVGQVLAVIVPMDESFGVNLTQTLDY